MKHSVYTFNLKRWGKVTAEIGLQHYRDGTPAFIINSSKGPIATMSVCVPGTKLGDDEILIKGWSENQQIFEELVLKGALIQVRPVPTGFVKAWVCKVNTAQFTNEG